MIQKTDCEELQQVLDHFLKYHMIILLGDFNAKLGSQDIFKQTIRNKSIHQNSNDNGVQNVNFATPKILVLKAQSSRTETFINTLGLLQMGRLTLRLITYC